VGLRKYYTNPRSPIDFLLRRPKHLITACDDVSLTISSAETLGLVGESGSGKSTIGRLLLALEKPDYGAIEFDGFDLLKADSASLRKKRRAMQPVFQDPLVSLNPRYSVFDAISHPLRTHGQFANYSDAQTTVRNLLTQVGLSETMANRLPHELSGGQAQRVCIARAIALRPKLIIGDEPTSSLDVSVQAQILNLLNKLQQDLGVAYLFISHDLRVVRHISHKVAVMYAGEIVENGPTQEIFDNPQHPYTRELLDSVPRPNPDRRTEKKITQSVSTDVPIDRSGCRYLSRCQFAQSKCKTLQPLRQIDSGEHVVRCVRDDLPRHKTLNHPL
jgi:oligopeptide/dipeptide ABC transporter ATP-binding protein